jgi:hypothetical protein
MKSNCKTFLSFQGFQICAYFSLASVFVELLAILCFSRTKSFHFQTYQDNALIVLKTLDEVSLFGPEFGNILTF